MAYYFSVNNKYSGSVYNPSVPSSRGTLDGSKMWFWFKSQMVSSSSWSVTSSGYCNGAITFPTSSMTDKGYSNNSDVITDAVKMGSDFVWFVLTSTGQVDGKTKEFLFYRQYANRPTANSDGYNSGKMEVWYSASQGFSKTDGMFGAPVDHTNPPIAIDGVLVTNDFQNWPPQYPYTGSNGHPSASGVNDTQSSVLPVPTTLSTPSDIYTALNTLSTQYTAHKALYANDSPIHKYKDVSGTTITSQHNLASLPIATDYTSAKAVYDDIVANYNLHVQASYHQLNSSSVVDNFSAAQHTGFTVTDDASLKTATIDLVTKFNAHLTTNFVHGFGRGSYLLPTEPGYYSVQIQFTRHANTGFTFYSHCCIGGSAEKYNFYLIVSNSTSTYGSSSFLAMDYVEDANASDNDKHVVWCVTDNNSHTAGQSGEPYYISTRTDNSSCIKAWYNKPATFTSRSEMVNSALINNDCGFLSASVAKISACGIDVSPRGIGSNLYDNKDELFPVMYFRKSGGVTGGALPSSYKGKSTLFKINSVARNQYELLNVDNTRDHVVVGYPGWLVVPWKQGELFKSGTS